MATNKTSLKKKCGLCKQNLRLNKFYKGSAKYKRAFYCKICSLVKSREWEKANREKRNQQKLRYYQKNRGQIIAYRHKWVKSPIGVASIKKTAKKRLVKNRKNHLAHVMVENAIKTGKIIKTPCLICKEIKSEAHHWKSYEKEDWYQIFWLCRKHHNLYHSYRSHLGAKKIVEESTPML